MIFFMIKNFFYKIKGYNLIPNLSTIIFKYKCILFILELLILFSKCFAYSNYSAVLVTSQIVPKRLFFKWIVTINISTGKGFQITLKCKEIERRYFIKVWKKI